MNKPAKILLATTLLVFAAAGFYYAWMAPAKKPSTSGSAPVVVRRDPVGAKVPAESAGRDLRETASMDRAAMPTPVPAPAANTATAAPPAPGAPEGFRAANAPAGTLPDRLEGFDKAPAGDTGTVTTTTRPAAAPSPSAAPGATPATPAGGTAVPAPLPPLPAPSGGVAAPARTVVPPAAKPATPASPAKPAETTYTVKAGDSLAGIWKQLTGSERGWEKLQTANPGLDPSRLKIGQVLKVPPFETAAPASPAASASAGPGDYVVKEGDTLSSIAAEKLGASKRWKEIYDANKAAIGADPAALKVGMKLSIPGQSPAKPALPAKPAGGTPATPTTPASPVTVPPALPSLPGPGNPAPAGAGASPAPGSSTPPAAPGTQPPAPRSP
jgi:nucleoid-associated protein YgaU